jgi:ATP-dependent protease ClpP protease subunit
VQDTVSIILNNTGTKLFFRNTDVDTQERLKTLIPSNTLGNFHIADVRPVSTLKVGECYYLLVDGRWGRGQVKVRSGVETQPSGINKPEPKKQPDDSVFANPSMCPLLDEVTAGSILSLCNNIDQAVYYFQYRHITIEICSPGGSVSALEHFFNKQIGWRKRNVIFETVATISTASAAAMMLSLGDVGHRKAYSTASLHYHYSRIQTSGEVFTKVALDQRSASLSKIDDKFISELVRHVYDNKAARELIDLKKLYKTLQENKSPLSLPAIGYEPKAQGGTSKIDPKLPRKPSREKYGTVLRELFANDMAIRPQEAKLLGLIDEVIGDNEENNKVPNKDNPANNPS